MRSDWSVLYIVGKIFSKAIRLFFSFSKRLDLRKIWRVQSFGATRVPVLGPPLANPREK